MTDRTAVIIIDTGFSLESIRLARKILAILDVRDGSIVTGLPYLTWEHNACALAAFAGDPMHHGSLVLQALMREAPHLPVILVSAYDQKGLIRTSFKDGKIYRPGWTEAYLTAVHIAKVAGLNSVANCSFGGYTHAADGTGWESHCLSTVTGPGKPGHIVVAGAGTGTGANIHASWRTEPGKSSQVTSVQASSATYNFWCAASAESPQFNDWLLEVFLDGRKLGEEYGCNLIPNLWNNRKQVTFHIEGAGTVTIRTKRFSGGRAASSGRFSDGRQAPFSRLSYDSETSTRCLPLPDSPGSNECRFDCWINQLECDATFSRFKDPMLIAEPAIFPHVISVGLASGDYAIDQFEDGAKPDLLIDGAGPISFRLPEIAADIAGYLADDPALDAVAVRNCIRRTRVA